MPKGSLFIKKIFLIGGKKMKKSTMKVLSLIMALAMIAGTLAVVPFSAMPFVVAEHVHTKGELIKTEDPTCNLYGYSVYTCAECGKTFADDVTEMLEHDYQEVGEVPATCENPGTTAGRKCVNCGDVLYGCERIEPAHVIAYRLVDGTYEYTYAVNEETGEYEIDENGNYVITGIETTADCLAGVTYQKYCKACGKVLDDTVATIVAPKDHSLKAIITAEPTCTVDGTALVYCTNETEWPFNFEDCEFVAEVAIDALGHIPVEKRTEDGNPYFHYEVCDRCGEILKVYDEPETPCEHTWVSNGYSFAYASNANLSSKNFEGTAEEYIAEYAKYCDISDLYEIFVCAECNAQKVEVKFEKIDHVYGNFTFKFNGKVITAAGTTTLGTVAEEEGEIVPITYYEVSLEGGYIDRDYQCEEPVIKTSYCAICAAREGDEYEPLEEELSVQEHDYTGWICQNEGCKENKKFVIDNKTYYECTNCMHYHAEKVCLNKKGTERSYIDYVVAIYVDYENDEYVEGDESADEFIIKANGVPEGGNRGPEAVGDMKYCFYDNMGDLDFAVGVHDVEDVVRTEPGTCVDRSYTYSYCLICGTKCDVEYGEIDRNNHNFGEWFTVTAPSCYEEGLERRVCLNDCGAKEDRTIEIDPTAHPVGEDTWVMLLDGNDEPVIVPATCVAAAQNIFYCKYCDARDYKDVEDGEPLPKNVLESHYAKDETQYNHKNINAVNRSVATCVEGGTKAYEYCTLCDTIITIEGVDVFEEMMTQYVWDEELEEFVLNPVLVVEALGHDLEVEEGEDANCFKAGRNPLVRCLRCGKIFTVAEAIELNVQINLEGLDDDLILNGAVIPAYMHNLAEKELEEGDVLAAEPIYVELYIDDEDYQAKEFALKLRTAVDEDGDPRIDVLYENDNIIGYGYYLNYVESTCTTEGYVVGKYCTICSEKFGILEDDYFDGVFGYKIVKAAHDYMDPVVVELPENIDDYCGGEVFYAYTINFCRACEQVTVTGYDKAVAKEHKPVVYDRTIADVQTKGEPKLFDVVFDGEELVEYDAHIYPDCSYAIYTAKQCRYCGEFYDEEIKSDAKGHYVADGTPIDITCTGYNKAFVGAKCAACGLRLPDYTVEDITEGEFKGLQKEIYRTVNGIVMAEEDVEDFGYFLIDHDWAETLDCEKTIIKECSVCGIKVLNERFKDYGYHEYFLVEGGIDAFDLDEYKYLDYAYDDVIVPTATSEGFGTLTCVKCGQELEVVIPAAAAEMTAQFDDGEYVVEYDEQSDDYVVTYVREVLVGNEVTVTVKVSANNFKFNELTLYVGGLENVVELVDVEILYDFGETADVTAYINADGDVILRTPGIDERNATITGDNVPFLKLTYKTGDLTLAKEISTVDFMGIYNYDVLCIDENGNRDDSLEGEINLQGAVNFGELRIYNPSYTVSAISVLAQIYTTEYNEKFDFNKDGRVDFEDYLALVDYIDSEGTIADFCELVDYDVEAMLDGLDYSRYTSRKSIVNDPTQIDWTYGEANDIAYGKNVVKRELAKANYEESIIGEGTTIADFAQAIIDANTL
jgi:hypothetical protein